ncbi:hypothetical protein YC2023_041840 [Brassica napus]
MASNISTFSFKSSFKDINKMRDSLPVKLALPELRYMIGSEPSQNDSINNEDSPCVLTKSIKTVKKHEAWFHFGAQPMRFSIRKFHVVTDLKCRGEEKDHDRKPRDLSGTSYRVLIR